MSGNVDAGKNGNNITKNIDTQLEGEDQKQTSYFDQLLVDNVPNVDDGLNSDTISKQKGPTSCQEQKNEIETVIELFNHYEYS